MNRHHGTQQSANDELKKNAILFGFVLETGWAPSDAIQRSTPSQTISREGWGRNEIYSGTFPHTTHTWGDLEDEIFFFFS